MPKKYCCENTLSCAISSLKLSPKLAQFLWQFLVEGNLHNYFDILPSENFHWPVFEFGSIYREKSWLVLNWPLSQPCAKNNHRRSVFVSNLVFFLDRRQSPKYDDEVLVFCALLLQKNKAEKCRGKDANGREGGYLTSKPENWTLFLSKVKYRWYPMHRCAHCLLHNA